MKKSVITLAILSALMLSLTGCKKAVPAESLSALYQANPSSSTITGTPLSINAVPNSGFIPYDTPAVMPAIYPRRRLLSIWTFVFTLFFGFGRQRYAFSTIFIRCSSP